MKVYKLYYKWKEKFVAVQLTFTSPQVQILANQSSSQLHFFNIIWTAWSPKSKYIENQQLGFIAEVDFPRVLIVQTNYF